MDFVVSEDANQVNGNLNTDKSRARCVQYNGMKVTNSKQLNGEVGIEDAKAAFAGLFRT